MLRPFDRPCYELRKEHDIEGVDTKVPLRFLPSSIHFNRIAHCLKGMKGKTDGQDDGLDPVGRGGKQTDKACKREPRKAQRKRRNSEGYTVTQSGIDASLNIKY